MVKALEVRTRKADYSSSDYSELRRLMLPYLSEHIAQKRAIYERYEKGLADLPLKMNPWDKEKSSPNFWLSCCTINTEAMTYHVRNDMDEEWNHEEGKSCVLCPQVCRNGLQRERPYIWDRPCGFEMRQP